jgi:hypothetical protein
LGRIEDPQKRAEWIAKLKIARVGRKPSLGKHHSEEHREKLRLSNIGKHNFTHTPEAIAKIAAASARQAEGLRGRTHVDIYGPEKAAEISRKMAAKWNDERTTKRGRCYTDLSIECTKQHDPQTWCKYCLFAQDLEFRQRLSGVLWSAKRRATKLNLSFAITYDDFISAWPDNNCCPIFGIPFDLTKKEDRKGGGRNSSPSLDRVVPELGYLPHNIAVISQRANTIKNDCFVARNV